MKPMLSGKADLDTLKYPVMVSPKLDGVRCIIKDGIALSRSLKPIPNKFVQELFGKEEYNGLDGELIVGDPTANDVYKNTVSGVMSIEGQPDVRYYIFDRWDLGETPFEYRNVTLFNYESQDIIRVPQYVVTELDYLLTFVDKWLTQGYEGIMIRAIRAYYKFGRSTTREGILLKYKQWEDCEAQIIGFDEMMHNRNEPTLSPTGNQVRATCKEYMEPAGKLGKFIVSADVPKLGIVEFKIGSGLTDQERQEIWDNQGEWIGKLIKFKYFPIGTDEKPRQPIYLGVRDERDL